MGAYQIGVWRVIAPLVRPDLIVGVSIGSLNGWMAASGVSPEKMEEFWLDGEAFRRYRFRIPRRPTEGVLDPSQVHAMIQRLHGSITPKIPFSCVMLRVPGLKAQIVSGPDVTWRHLAASCALPGIFDAQRFDEGVFIDGGILDPLPFWAARKLGATKILGINCLTWGGRGEPSFVVNAKGAKQVRQSGSEPVALQIRPHRRLLWRPNVYWNRHDVESNIRQGELDAAAAIKTFAFELF